MLRKALAYICGMFAITTICATTGMATGFDLGIDANYALIDLGSGTTLGWNSGPVAGSVLLGNGVTLAASGGNNGGVSNGGIVYYDSTAKNVVGAGGTLSQLQNPPPSQLVSTSVTNQALTTAQSVSAYAASLAATQMYGNITSAKTISATTTTNVIDVANIQNAPLTISGNASDFFIFNVSGEFQTNVAMTLTGGVLASHILFNFTGTSGQVLNTSGGNTLYGTYLATNGGQFQFSNLNLTGELINTGGNVQLVSGSSIPKFSPFTTPEPSTLILLIAAIPGLVLLRRVI